MRFANARCARIVNEGTVWLWHAASCDWQDAELHARFADVLTVAERQRMGQFLRPADRSLYLLAHGLLRRALATAMARSPADIDIRHQARGKPYVDGGPDFSLTHALSQGDAAAGAAVVAICGGPVGVDVESRARWPEISELVSSRFAWDEQAMLAGVAEQERRERMVWLWTAKEAVIKATGDGLATPLRSVVMTWGDDGVLRTQGWWLTRIRLAGFVGTVATRHAPAVIQLNNELPGGPTAVPGAVLEIVG